MFPPSWGALGSPSSRRIRAFSIASRSSLSRFFLPARSRQAGDHARILHTLNLLQTEEILAIHLVKPAMVSEGRHRAGTDSVLMYLIVPSSRGMTTCSSAFTRRLVILITSSRITNAVCAGQPEREMRKGGESDLEGSELDESLDGLGEGLATLCDLLSTASESGEAVACGR